MIRAAKENGKKPPPTQDAAETNFDPPRIAAPSLPPHPPFKYLYSREARTARAPQKAESRREPLKISRAPKEG